jgi:hypothetical protein
MLNGYVPNTATISSGRAAPAIAHGPLSGCRSMQGRPGWINTMESDEQPDIGEDTQRLRRALFLSVSFAAVLWVVKLSEMLASLELALYGTGQRCCRHLNGPVYPWLARASAFQHGTHHHSRNRVCPEDLLRINGQNGRSCRITLLIVRSGDAGRRGPEMRPPYPGLADAPSAGSVRPSIRKDAFSSHGSSRDIGPRYA